MVYYSLFSIFSIFCLYDVFGRKNSVKNILFVLSTLIVIFFSTIRWKTGTDWIPYYNYFVLNDSFSDFFNVSGFEFGFIVYNFLIKSISSEYTFMLFITVFIVCFFKYKSILSLSAFPLVAFLLNFSFYAGDLFTVRQGIAIAFTAYSVIYVKDKKPFHFIFFVVLASCFHMTALIFLFAYKIYHYKIDKIKILKILSFCFILTLTFDMSSILLTISSYFFPFITSKIQIYSELSSDSQGLSNIPAWLTLTIGFIKRFVILCFLFWIMDRIDDKRFQGVLNLFIFSIFMFVFLTDLHITFQRLTMYYAFFEIIVLSYAFVAFKKDTLNQFALLVLLIFYSYTKFIYGLNTNYDLFFPYETIFQTNFKQVY